MPGWMKFIWPTHFFWENTGVRFLPIVIALFSYCLPGNAAQIGETRAEVIARHGSPPLADNSKGLAIYRWDLWKLEIQFVDDVVRKLTYTKTDPLSETDVAGILVANGGTSAWKSLSKGLWMRSDGALASMDKSTGRSLRIQGGRKFTPPSPVQDVVSHVFVTPVTSSTPMPATSASPLPTTSFPAPFQIISKIPAHVTPAPMQFSAYSKNGSNPFGLLSRFLVIGALAFGLNRLNERLKKNRNIQTSRHSLQSLSSKSCEASQSPTPDSVTWDQFELVIAEIYRRQGYTVEVSSGLGADGGIDITLSRDDAKTLVQCKQRRTESVGVKPVRELFGVLVSEHATRAIMVTTNEYTRDAREFADGKPIDLLMRSDVLALIKSVEQPGENLWDVDHWIADFVGDTRILDPDCPRCRKPMVIRQPANGTSFWGCPDYPRCHGKRDARMKIIKARSYQSPASCTALRSR